MTRSVLLLILLSALGCARVSAQVSYPISSHRSTPDAFRYLLLTNQQIDDNDTINEEIVDLVNPLVQDSVLGDKRKPHHRLFLVGWLIHTFAGFGWREVDHVKQKFVGTAHDDGRSGEDQYTEYDINFSIYFHTRRYQRKVFKSYDKQAKIKRQDIASIFMPRQNPRTNYHAAPFVRDTNNINADLYGMHCELTPPKPFRPILHYLFYPCIPGINIDQHPNFMTEHPTMGFYGASCLDCNHNCHPEIHPYEWIWWMNLHNGSERDKVWLLGMMKESSNRFPGWSSNPKTGKVNVPFAWKVTDPAATNRTITIEHLVFGAFIDTNIAQLNPPVNTFRPDQSKVVVNLTDDKGATYPVTVAFANALNVGGGLKYWFSDVNWDEQNHILSGYINVATSVKDVYTTKVTMSGQ